MQKKLQTNYNFLHTLSYLQVLHATDDLIKVNIRVGHMETIFLQHRFPLFHGGGRDVVQLTDHLVLYSQANKHAKADVVLTEIRVLRPYTAHDVIVSHVQIILHLRPHLICDSHTFPTLHQRGNAIQSFK